MSVAVVACDPLTRVEVIIDAQQPLGIDCVQQVPQHIGAVDKFSRLPRQPSVNGEQFVVQRGAAVVYIALDGASPEVVGLGFGWQGTTSLDEEQEHLRLLDDVQSSIIRACSLESDKTQVTQTCVGRLCKELRGDK